MGIKHEMTKEEIKKEYEENKITYEEAMNLIECNTDMWKDDAEKFLSFKDDNIIINQSLNIDIFAKLHKGDWQSYFASQSEADVYYVKTIALYTKNRTQIARIFRASELGRRDKAQRKDYVELLIFNSIGF